MPILQSYYNSNREDEIYKTTQNFQCALRSEKIINEYICFLSKSKKRDLILMHCKLYG